MDKIESIISKDLQNKKRWYTTYIPQSYCWANTVRNKKDALRILQMMFNTLPIKHLELLHELLTFAMKQKCYTKPRGHSPNVAFKQLRNNYRIVTIVGTEHPVVRGDKIIIMKHIPPKDLNKLYLSAFNVKQTVYYLPKNERFIKLYKQAVKEVKNNPIWHAVFGLMYGFGAIQSVNFTLTNILQRK